MNKKTDWGSPSIRMPGRDGLITPIINAHDTKVTSARAKTAKVEGAAMREGFTRHEEPLPNFVSPKPHRAGHADNDNLPFRP